MKKFFALLLATLMVVALAACSGSTPAETKTFTVGFDQDFPPYGYVENGVFAGFDLDLAREVAARNGWTIQLTPINWDAKDFELDSGAIDCIWNGFTMNGREDAYTWSKPYIDNSQVIVVRKDSGISTFDDLAGKVVAVQTDSSAQAALNSDDCADLAASFAKTLTFAEYNTAFMELEAGSVDAIAMDIGVANYQVAGREDQFLILDQTLVAEQYGIGFKLGNTALRDTVQKTYDAMLADGTVAKLAEKYGLSDCVID